MKRMLFICLTTALAFTTTAQQTNLTGWAIIMEGTRYKTLMPEGIVYQVAQNNRTKIEVSDFGSYKIAVGEPILVMDNFKGGVLAFDPMGRVVFIESKNTLTAVTGYNLYSTGMAKENINLLDGSMYPKGKYVLIVSESYDTNTYTAVTGPGVTAEIPMSKIELVRNRFTRYMDYVKFDTAQN